MCYKAIHVVGNLDLVRWWASADEESVSVDELDERVPNGIA